MTNLGAQGVDQIQWALGKSLTGPTEIVPVTPGLNGKVTMRYADGAKVRFELDRGPDLGAIFIGDDEANQLLDRPRRKGYELPSTA